MQTMMLATIMVCVLITLLEVIGTKVNPVSGIHNLPREIQERVHAMPQYQGKLGRILSTKERIVKKLPALVLLLVVFTGVVYVAGARNFLQGFVYTFLMWAVVKLYVSLVLVCGWYAHTPSMWIPGTTDMKASYQNYKFYLSSIPRSLLAGTLVGAIIGGIIQLAA